MPFARSAFFNNKTHPSTTQREPASLIMTKAILFSDFDGTITLQDSNDFLTDNLGMGHEERMKLNVGLKDQTLAFRDGFYSMLTSVAQKGYSLDKAIDILSENIELDSGFKETLEWCVSQDIAVVIVSSGMELLIKALLTKLVGDELAEHLTIYSNGTKFDNIDDSVPGDGLWRIKYRDASSFGHDKNESIKAHVKKVFGDSKQGTLFYSGDGVSDISASRSCDVLFAKAGLDLIDICKEDNIPYVEFHSFKDILSYLKSYKF